MISHSVLIITENLKRDNIENLKTNIEYMENNPKYDSPKLTKYIKSLKQELHELN